MKKASKSWMLGGLAAVIALALVQTASAALISMDFGPTMASVTSDQGGGLYTADLKNAGNAGDQIGIWENAGTVNVWNYKAANSHTGLYDADGNVTTVGYSITIAGSTNPASGWTGDDLLTDGYYCDPGSAISWAITGLTPNANYGLVAYMNQQYSSTLVTVNSTSPTTYIGTQSPASYTEGTQFWYFEVQADAGGTLSGVSGYAPGDTTHQTFTGFQLVAIPEPASGLTLFAGAVGLGLLRRKLRG